LTDEKTRETEGKRQKSNGDQRSEQSNTKKATFKRGKGQTAGKFATKSSPLGTVWRRASILGSKDSGDLTNLAPADLHDEKERTGPMPCKKAMRTPKTSKTMRRDSIKSEVYEALEGLERKVPPTEKKEKS